MKEKETLRFILDFIAGAEEGWNVIDFLENIGYQRNEISKKFNETSNYIMELLNQVLTSKKNKIT